MHLDLDEAWDADVLGLERRDARSWGPRLRCFAPRNAMETFIRDVAEALPPFVLYGSGDFHHLAAAFLRNVRSGDVHLVSFDNHPDWDRRPPHWACGGWMNRAVELPNVRGAHVWGCGNFELNFPARVFGNRNVEVHAWAERYPRTRFDSMTRDKWRSRFEEFAESLHDRDVYITVDMDCLREEDAATNWENGLFTADDLRWAIGRLHSRANVVGGDVCGAYSPPLYARRLQRFAAEWDHPKIRPRADARAINTRSLQVIWPALVNFPTPASHQR